LLDATLCAGRIATPSWFTITFTFKID